MQNLRFGWYRQRLIADRSHCNSVEMSSRSQSASLEARREERCTACNPLPRDWGMYWNFMWARLVLRSRSAGKLEAPP